MTQGIHSSDQVVFINDIQLPEFVNQRHIEGAIARVFDSPHCPYDIILGQDFLQAIGIKMDFKLDTIQWLDTRVDMKNIKQFDNGANIENFMQRIKIDLNYLDIDVEDKYLCDDKIDTYASEILESKYGKVSVDNVAAKQEHLTDEQQIKLRNMLRKHEVLFDGKLDCYPQKQFHLDLIDGVEPVHSKSYGIPYQQEELFKQELKRLCDEGVSEKCGPSRWAAPTFITPKKDGQVCWVSDFRELNKLLNHQPFPLPRIQDIMNRCGKYKWFTKIDLSMFFYCFQLDEESKAMCTIATPFGLYRYTCLAMGIKISPDIAQSVINKILDGLDTEGYIDDCGYWSDGSFDDHLKQVDKILTRLKDNGMKCNLLKCDWMVHETNFLGHSMTPTHIKPMKKKIDAILCKGRPQLQHKYALSLAQLTSTNHYSLGACICSCP